VTTVARSSARTDESSPVEGIRSGQTPAPGPLLGREFQVAGREADREEGDAVVTAMGQVGEELVAEDRQGFASQGRGVLTQPGETAAEIFAGTFDHAGGVEQQGGIRASVWVLLGRGVSGSMPSRTLWPVARLSK
jgi:hypothetical protein